MREQVRPVRCAVYTRKSTEDGLDQEFNSLDAQREACAAYITSQRHEGWTPLPERYDDGGFSGGSMERPAFKRLLAEVAAGYVDVIVIYKVDRLTRSLADFSKIVDVLDRAKASFVSITQAFNTTTSMGRLTLNMLLSFAQFEREVTGERIRDKIAASRRKGLWMGGPMPLGYAVQDRRLVVAEAELVRHVMAAFEQALKYADIAATTLRSGTASAQLPLVRQLVEQVALRDEAIAITVSASAMLTLCGVTSSDPNADHNPAPITLACPTARVRRGHELRLVIPAAGAPKPIPVMRDEKLVALLAEAHAARQLVLSSPDWSINRIAADAGRCRTRVGRLFGVAHLAPSIVTAIVEGRQPAGLRARDLLAASLPVDWAEQRELLGFGNASPS